ncbi:MAG: hypothetical protein ABJ349_07545, partial [Hyphomicrobiales bacterium]
YDAAVTAAEAALAEAANGATPLILGTISHVGAGQIDRAAMLFQRVALNAPKLADARLAGRWLSSNPDYLTRAHTFFRVAAGQLSSKDADALR